MSYCIISIHHRYFDYLEHKHCEVNSLQLCECLLLFLNQQKEHIKRDTVSVSLEKTDIHIENKHTRAFLLVLSKSGMSMFLFIFPKVQHRTRVSPQEAGSRAPKGASGVCLWHYHTCHQQPAPRCWDHLHHLWNNPGIPSTSGYIHELPVF